MIKWWLERCDREHLACMAKQYMPTGPKRLPTRLLDVGTEDDTFLRLFKGSELHEKFQYVTLSHCWGGFKPVFLTSGSIQEMKLSIKADTLPKTFQDAISITRQLGFRYLWIHSLCIIQDSKDDWQQEALRMKDVYQQAMLNIAAAKSPDGRGGCFTERDSCLVMSHTTGIDWEGYRGKYRLIDTNLRKDEVINTPLESWGWVLQERLLSTKKVYFSKNQVFWGYQEAQGYEAYPSMLPTPMLTVPAVWQNLNMWHNGVQLSAWGKQSSGLEDFCLSAYALWDRIVQTYSGLAFTQNTDRLIALSGVAKVVATLIEDEYLAGIWRSRLLRGLIWSVNNPDTASRPESYIAPSWSLASVCWGSHLSCGYPARSK
jgi:hypothetical protein